MTMGEIKIPRDKMDISLAIDMIEGEEPLTMFEGLVFYFHSGDSLMRMKHGTSLDQMNG